MKAGRELDALVAEKVMGLTVYDDAGDLWEGPPSDLKAQPIPRYSTSIAAAWQVVEDLQRRDKRLSSLGAYNLGGWRALFAWQDNTTLQAAEGIRDTAPHAICIAALCAVGVEL